MPLQKKWLQLRTQNLSGSIKKGLKHVSEACSPRRRQDNDGSQSPCQQPLDNYINSSDVKHVRITRITGDLYQ
ncbi:hypothetical protein K435DRAFT_881646 [Dendrothele bispora CBS 962.96]|uniref:Uncharacterized protein n=1 Tax=Dendrothele bispora (strain CBS 962.96) TaxID=1314807 RepID=A0A4S8KJ34_DENBC|nr:hypothetical protein K435DRAFT_881646 [Dendrothele bispora CBS 962.96]